MKKLINICILSFAVIIANAQAQPAGCCPEFSLSTNPIHPCDDNACKPSPVDPNGGAGGNGSAQSLIACKNQPQTYYVVPALPGCYTEGRTLEEARSMATDAIQAYCASLLKHGEPIPDP